MTSDGLSYNEKNNNGTCSGCCDRLNRSAASLDLSCLNCRFVQGRRAQWRIC